MTRLTEIQSHIGSMGELLDIVGAMRSLAGMRVQEAQRTLLGIRRYAETMAAAVGDALRLAPEPPLYRTGNAKGRRALVLYAAEHGFVGGFNERLIDTAEAALMPGDSLFILGSRGAALEAERGRRVWARPMATRAASAPEAIQPLAAELYAAIARGRISRIDVIYARYRQGAAATIERHALLPLDLPALAAQHPGQPPLHNLPAEALLEKLAAEYVFARLTEAAVESIASENEARFAAMESAHDNVSKKLDLLRQDERQARQAEITTELLDLIAGTEALIGRHSPGSH